MHLSVYTHKRTYCQALTLQIRALEEEVGVRLFERNRRKTALTEAHAWKPSLNKPDSWKQGLDEVAWKLRKNRPDKRD